MWSTVWKCIFDTLKSIYTVMNTIKIFDINNQFSISLWDLSIGVIVMGSILNLFINFTTPTMPDRWDSGVGSRARSNVSGSLHHAKVNAQLDAEHNATRPRQGFLSRWTL